MKQRVLTVLTVGFVGCNQAGPPGQSTPDTAATGAVRVQIESLSPTTFKDRIEATGSLEADNDATLSARASGTLEFLAALGRSVGRGDIVARIESGIPESAVRQASAAKVAAEASLELAKQRFDRQRPLFEEGVISALEFQQIQAGYQQARAQLAQAEANLVQAKEVLSNNRIVAPFKGVVDAHFVDRGEQVTPGAPVVRVVDASTLIVKAGIPERYAADINVGASVEVRLPAYGLEPQHGEVNFVATAINPKSRTFDIEVAVENPEGKLKPEMVAKLVVTRAHLQNVLVVPQSAVLRDEEGPHIFLVNSEDGLLVARRKSIRALGGGSGQVVVEGPSAGDRVVVLGQTKLIDGDFVDVGESAAERDGLGRGGAGPNGG